MKKYLLYSINYISQPFPVFFLLILSGILFSQQTFGQIDCPSCSANDFKVNKYYLASDALGTPLNGVCSGSSQNVYLFMQVTSSSTRYSLHVEYDITTTNPVTGISNTVSITDCLYEFSAIPISLINLSLNTGPFSWICGEQLEISNFGMAWKQKIDLPCTTEPPKCLCIGESTVVHAPLSVNYNWETYCSPGNGISWIKAWSITNGGDGSYINTWTYTGGTLENEIADTIWVSYPDVSSYSITLEVEDGTPQSDTETKSVTTIACCEDPVITDQPDNETICLNNPVTLSVSATVGTGSINFQWQSSTDNITFTNLTGETSSTYSPATSTAGTMYYRVIISNTIAGCNNITSNVATVIVDEQPVANAGSGGDECGLNFSLAATPSVGNGVWAASPSSGVSFGDAANASTTVTVPDYGTYTFTWAETNGTCSDDDNVVVNFLFTPTPTGDSPQIFCSDNNPTLNNINVTGTNIQWYDSPVGGNLLPGSTSLIHENIYYATQTLSGCESQDRLAVTANVYDPLNAVIFPSSTEINCNTSQITLNSILNGEIGSVTYLWSTADGNIVSGEFTSDIVLDQPGEYILRVIDSGSSCEIERSITITEDYNAPTANISPSHEELTCDTTNIVLDASVSAGQGALLYLWNTGETSSQITVSSPGIYSVILTDTDNGCTDFASIEIDQNIITPNTVISKSHEELTCDTLSITLDASGSTGQGDLLYLWNNGLTNSSIVIIEPGTYSVTITDDRNGCTDVASIVISENIASPVIEISASQTELTCNTTDILLSADILDSGAGTLIYEWNTGETSNQISIDSPGLYSVTVTNLVNGCTATAEINIGHNITLPLADIQNSEDHLTCEITDITLSGSGSAGQETLNYLWSTGETTENIGITMLGVYELTVTDTRNGCSHSTTIDITQDINEPFVAIEEPVSNILTCDTREIVLDASVNVIDNSGEDNLKYNWSPGGEITSSIKVSSPGIYSVTVIDPDNGCTFTDIIQIFQNINQPVADIYTPETTSLTCSQTEIILNGLASIDNSGVYNLMFSWMPGGENIPSIEVTHPDKYKVLVTDPFNGCSSLDSIIITQDINTPLAIIEKPITTILNCNIDEITLDASTSIDNSGEKNLLFSWTGGETTPIISATEPGIYTVTVTDLDNGCTSVASVELFQDLNATEAVITTPVTTILTCIVTEINLDASGSVDNSGEINLEYLWSTGETTSSITVTEPGTYVVTVIDQDNGCSSLASQTISQDIKTPDALIGEPVTTELNCNTGEINLDASGSVDNSGEINLEYLWSTGETTSSITVTEPGTYIVTVTDQDNGCSSLASQIISQDIKAPDALIGEPVTTELNCITDNILLDASVSTDNSLEDNLLYEWSTGENTEIILANELGTYFVTVTDQDNGCSDLTSILITQDINSPEALIETPPTSVLTCSVTEIELNASGSVDNSGLNNLEFSWSNGSNSASILVSVPGTYTVNITDPDNGCTSETSITITQDINTPEAVIQSLPELTIITCSTPEIVLNASGSVDRSGINNLQFEWSTGETGSSITVSQQGTYFVNIIDPDNGCSASTSVNVTEDLNAPVAIISNPVSIVLNCNNESIVLDAISSEDNSGENNLEFNWSNGEATPNITTTEPGTYTVSINDPDNGCSDQASIIISVSETMSCSVIINNEPNCFGGSDASATVFVTGGDENYSYLWDNGETTATATALNAGTHSVEVTDQFGCTTSCAVVITNSDELIVVAESNSPVCSGSDLMLFENSRQAISWEWSGPNGFTSEIQNPIISNTNTLYSGQYQVVVSNGSCSDTAVINVDVNPQPNAVDDDYNAPVNTGIEGSVLDNDAIIGGSLLTVSLVDGTSPGNGTLNLENDGSFTYTPNANFVGQDNFTYIVCSEEGCCDEAEVTINIESAAATDPPFANNDYYSTTCLDIDGQNVLDNDIYLINVLVEQVSGTTNGTLTLNEDGTFMYRPMEGFVGQDRFTYRLCYIDETDNCSNLAEVLIDVDCACELYIPNGFSPNGDNVNDYFEVLCLDNYPNAHLLIYNRWGNLVYEQEDYGNSDRWGNTDRWWDGRSINKLDIGNDILPAATYMYILILEENGDTRTGTIFLNR